MLYSETVLQIIKSVFVLYIMSIRLILTDNEITINEELKDNETIYNYINRAINNFDNKNNVNIYMIIQTDKEIINVKIK